MDEKTKDRIVELFDQGMFLEDIAAEVGYTSSRMTQILQERGRSAWKRRYPNQESWDWDAIYADYQNRMPFEEILQKHELSCTTFHRHRKADGVPKRPRLGAPGKQNYQYKNGLHEINQKLHSIYSYTARKVATVLFGEPIPKGWHVHHMNENPAYNDPTNLVLFPGNSQHMKYHQQLLKLQRAGVEVDATQLVLENDGRWLQLPPPQWRFSPETGQFVLLESQPLPTQDPSPLELDPSASGPQ
jgi:hypothetical protein